VTVDRPPGPTPEPLQRNDPPRRAGPGGPRPIAAEAIALPSAGDLALLVVALTAVATSGPLIAATAVPALAIAFWRTAMASAVLVPVALVRVRAEIRALSGRDWRLCLLAGALLAGHFATWVPSISLTSVASSTALVATQPVWAAMLARIAGRRVRPAVWLGIGVSVAGAGLLTGADLSLSGRALAGDVLATVGGILAAAYVTAGAAVRARTTTTAYTAVCYSTCAVLLLVLCLATGQRLGGYSGGAWLKLAGLTVGAQLLGHSLFNVLLRSITPTALSLAILFEAPGATLIAAVWLHQVPPVTAIPGLLALLAGIAVVVAAGTRTVPVE
jgi:drug/metabolite transporter (DMT)-like permease